MLHHPTASTLAIALLAALPAASAGLYPKSSPVLQLEAKDYDRVIAKSNYTSVVEFYAPWCGHCQNLKPAYEKVAKNLDGLAHVAAVNCDDDANKPFCGSMGVQGFPTLKIVRPSAKSGGKPAVEEYQGPRTATGIVDAVVDKINNHVKRVQDKDLGDFLKKDNDTAKAILFTEKGTTTALLKSIAIDFLDVVTVAQVRNTQKKAVETFGIKSFPALVLLPGGDKDGIVYDGEMKKKAIVKFLSQAGSPNPDPATAPAKPKDKKAKSSSSSSSSKKAKKPSASTESATTESQKPPLADDDQAEKPVVEEPVMWDKPLPIPIINTAEKLAKTCLAPKSHTCVLAFVPRDHTADSEAGTALAALAELAHKHQQSKRHLFPFYEVHVEDDHSRDILKSLGLSGDKVQVVALNARRGWWRLYEGAGFGHEGIEGWIDQIRLSEGTKRKLPDGLVYENVEEPGSSSSAAAEPSEATAVSEPTPDATDGGAADGAESSKSPKVTPEAEKVSESVPGEESTSTKGADPTVQEETDAEEGEKKTEKSKSAAHDEL